jgi:plasmid stabilization system protein ParE
MFEVRITDPAEQDIQRNYQWWRDNRDPEQAEKWYDSIYPAIASLNQMPRRCAFAREQEMFSGELRQLYFGIGRRATHRIVFTLREDKVFVLAVLHQSQERFRVAD